jgi:hypothetical protein
VDFLLDGVDPREYDDHGWGINIRHCNISFDKAMERITDDGILQIKAGNRFVEEVELDDSDFELLNLRHYAFSFLRKADPASFVFSKLEVEHRAPDYGRSSNSWTIMFLLPGNREFQFYYSKES